MNQPRLPNLAAQPVWGQRELFLVLLLALTALFWHTAAWAAPAAGTQIGNQASATYTDDSQTTRTVTSNTVTTIVQQVASLTLISNGARSATPGGQASYPHTLTNTGNGPDSFGLAATNTGSFVLSNVTFYADANGDGVADDATPITATGTLTAGSSFNFVAVGTVPGTAASGNTNSLVVSAASAFDATAKASNTDTTTVTANAAVSVTKAIDVAKGGSPSGPRTITLTYTNTGNLPATQLTITDALPSGMAYVAGSGRWSNTGSTVLTDADTTDNQGGIVYDFASATNTVTAAIAQVDPGTTGRLTFQVDIAGGLPPGNNAATANTASYRYNDGSGTVASSSTNTAQFTVIQSAALTMQGDIVASIPQGGTASFGNLLANTGNGTDTFDISIGTSNFPAGTTFTLYQSDSVTPMLDTNGNGIPDTGPLAAGANYNVVLKASLPPGATGGAYTVQKTATSQADPSKTVTVTDELTVIVGNSVDLSNNAAGTGAPGFGAGPEGAAVITNSADPGTTSRFTLYVANNSGVADSFDLAASSDSTFAALNLPEGWSVVFRDANGAVITNTGAIKGGDAKLVYADVTVPAGYTPGAVDIYFRSLSPTSAAGDRLHDAVQVSTQRAVTLTPNNSGQIYPGGSVVYSHTLANNGNVTEGDGAGNAIAFTLADDGAGFSSTLYWDKNNNGVLDDTDPVVSSAADLTGGSNGASTEAGLQPGESATLFVKVFAPGGAAPGAQDTATLTAKSSGTINAVVAPPPAVTTDGTTVIAGQVRLEKSQALDADCDGVPDTAYGTVDVAAPPGACVRYRIMAINAGIANVTAVTVSDATPANTTYSANIPAATTAGAVTAPGDGNSGTIQAAVGTLTPGQAAEVTFGVRINP
ncbi:hypothetical protein CAP31_12450 [Sulfuriferula sp. AH1]|uniref:beta strand repeat-containing protein n=1 Tax=Sulfuriferula sp. AH1 TaxID=1985873 RepID=UPI000B3BAA4A|nr:hypothetical protein [Sulfuriferula sp. AH1]ARU32416.1 hypothetical protein CAP31_12450 [Sulfuriferula sp. AH1]